MRKLSLLLALALAATVASAAPPAKPIHLNCNNSANFPNTDLTAYDFAVQATPTPGGTGAGKATASLILTLPPNANVLQLSQLVASGRHTSSCLLSSAGVTITLRDVNFIKLEDAGVTNPSTGITSSVVQLTLAFDVESTLGLV